MPIKDPLISRSDSPQWKEILKIRNELYDKYFEYWINNNLFTLSWWLMLILFISIWFIWWKLVDKSRLHEIVTIGLMVAFVASYVDVVGCEEVLWGYPNDLDPLITPLTVTDIGLLSIFYMLLYQYFNNWKSYIIVALIGSALIAFVAEPIAVMLDIFQLNKWKHLYDFPMYFVLAILIKWVMNKILKIQENSNTNHR